MILYAKNSQRNKCGGYYNDKMHKKEFPPEDDGGVLPHL
jgi:hypothetical protein